MRIETILDYQPYNTHSFKSNFKYKKQTIIDDGNKNFTSDKKNKKETNSAVTIITLSAVSSFFMLSKGFQKNANNMLNKIKDSLESRRNILSIQKSSQRTKFYDFILRGINSFIKKSESINNITSLKDILFMKLMYKSKPTKKIHESITNYFEKLSRKTVEDSYIKTGKYFKQMDKICNQLDEYILKDSPNDIIEHNNVKYSKKEWVDIARKNREFALTIANNFLSKEALKMRYDYIQKSTENLHLKFWDASFKDFWTKNNKFKQKEMWQTFIADEQIKNNKTEFLKLITAGRNAISDTNSMVHEYVLNFNNILPINDSVGTEIVKKLEWLSREPERFKNSRDLFFNELKKLEHHQIRMQSYKTAKIRNDNKQANIETIRDLADSDNGMIQDMILIYKKIAPFEFEKSGAKKAIKKAITSFDKSVNLESIEFFDKVRDLRLGSAPTDILTILLSFITLSIGLGYAKDKDDKISVMLKSGIPIIGGIAATVYTATKLVSGGKSLMFGFLSGIILNQFGKIADNIRKNKKELINSSNS